MNTAYIKTLIFSVFVLICISPTVASAHQPRIVEVMSTLTTVINPEISKAYYGKLEGEPHIFQLNASSSFDFYINILVPDILGQKKDVSVAIIKNGETETPLVVLEGINGVWTPMWERFGQDAYWKGGEYKSRADAGSYEIRVWSGNNDSKYVLAIGERESFGPKEIVNALTLVPKLKRNFFNESPAGFIFSPFGWSYVLIMYCISFIFGMLYRFLLRLYVHRTRSSSPRGLQQNIGTYDRLFRLGIGMALLVLAMTTNWSPILLFFSGFSLFEAIFSWCGFYAAIGKNTCSV